MIAFLTAYKPHTAVTMGEYVKRIDEINNEAVKAIERDLEGRGRE